MAEQPTPERRQRIDRALAREETALIASIRDHLADSEETRYAMLSDEVGDLEDQALADLLIDEGLAGIHREIDELRAVQAARQRLARGDWGRCIDCGETIADDRMDAMPTAVRCRDCQQVHERTHAQPGHHTL